MKPAAATPRKVVRKKIKHEQFYRHHDTSIMRLMKEFPTDFVDQPRRLPHDMSEDSQDAVWALGEDNLEVVEGLTPYYAGSIAVMAQQREIRMNYPEDQTAERFATQESTRNWMASSGGLAIFLMLEDVSEGQRLAGYGWTGPATCEHIRTGKTVFAIRVGENHKSKGPMASFGALVVEATRRRYEADNFWLETWESETPYNIAYNVIGFKPAYKDIAIRQEPYQRKQPDRRVYMKLD